MNHKHTLLYRYSTFAIVYMILLVFTPIIYSLAVNNSTVTSENSLIANVIAFISFSLMLFWMLRSIKKIDTNFIGCVIEFGHPLYQITSGLHFVPYLFCELRMISKLAIEEKVPDEYKNVPVKITHGTTSQPTGDPLDTRLTTSVNFKYRYKITDYVLFIKNVGNTFELKKQLSDIIINTAAIECSKLTLALNLGRRKQLNHLLMQAVIDWTKTWGIEVLQVQLQEIDLGNEIDKAQTNVSVSAINITSNRNDAQKIYYDGAAEAEVHKMFQYAKAEGIREIAEKLGVDDKSAIYQIETLANVWRKSNADLNLYGSDVQQLFGMLMSVYKDKENPSVKLK